LLNVWPLLRLTAVTRGLICQCPLDRKGCAVMGLWRRLHQPSL